MPLTKNRLAVRKPHRTFSLQSSRRVDVAALYRTYRLTQETLSRITGYSLRTVADWRTDKPLKPTATQRLVEAIRLCQALAEVIRAETIGHWLQTPNDAFDGSTPLQVIERGEADRLWKMIYRLESGEPG
jgi:uncharacterized protein (DUF2384 family)